MAYLYIDSTYSNYMALMKRKGYFFTHIMTKFKKDLILGLLVSLFMMPFSMNTAYPYSSLTGALRLPLGTQDDTLRRMEEALESADSAKISIAVHIVRYKDFTPRVSTNSALNMLREPNRLNFQVWDNLQQAKANFGEGRVAFVFEGEGLRGAVKPDAAGIWSMSFNSGIRLQPLFTKVFYNGYADGNSVKLFLELRAINKERISAGLNPVKLETSIYGSQDTVAVIIPTDDTTTADFLRFVYGNLNKLFAEIKSSIIRDVISARALLPQTEEHIASALTGSLEGLEKAEKDIVKSLPASSYDEAASLDAVSGKLDDRAEELLESGYLKEESAVSLKAIMAAGKKLKRIIDIIKAVENGGGDYAGMQYDGNGLPSILFNDPETKSTIDVNGDMSLEKITDRVRYEIAKKRNEAKNILPKGPYLASEANILYNVYEVNDEASIREVLEEWFSVTPYRRYFEWSEWNSLLKQYTYGKDRPSGFLIKLQSEKGEILGLAFFNKKDNFMFAQSQDMGKSDVSSVYFLDRLEVDEKYRYEGLGDVLVAKVVEKSLNDPDTKDTVVLAEPATKGPHSADNFFEKIGASLIHIPKGDMPPDLFENDEDAQWEAQYRILYRNAAEKLFDEIKNSVAVKQPNAVLKKENFAGVQLDLFRQNSIDASL